MDFDENQENTEEMAVYKFKEETKEKHDEIKQETKTNLKKVILIAAVIVLALVGIYKYYKKKEAEK